MSICGGFAVGSDVSHLPVPSPICWMKLLKSRGAALIHRLSDRLGTTRVGTRMPSLLPWSTPNRLLMPCTVEGSRLPACPLVDGGWPGRPAEWAFAAILARDALLGGRFSCGMPFPAKHHLAPSSVFS